MPKASDRVIYKEARKGKEQLSEQDEGVELPTDVKGYVMLRQVQEDQVAT